MTESGTGKTRTAASLTDVLSRGGYDTNVLFLADRTALVKQAKDAFKSYLPEMSLCNLCSNKDDRNARIVFSTYPTILNAISREHTSDGIPLFTPTHFDLIIIDESHRSIFKKYKAIFDYFDSMLVGLTATPKMDVDKNTYEFFEMEHNVPTYAYDYETAVDKDHVLVPYYSYEVKMKFAEEGIVYDDLPEDEKAKYEDDFAEDDGLPDLIPSSKLNKFVFNENTVDTVTQDLMENGIRIKGGDELGKTIIFAQNKRHAEFIIERFNHLYPQYHGKFAQRVICDDTYAQDIIDRFKTRDGDPQIAVSVDMMDTGIDVPDCVNLVFFKKVMSKTKFWQMIGRGTRLAPDISFVDRIDGEYTDKKRFIIFDYCGNFEFFRENPNGFEGNAIKSLSESIYEKKVRIISGLQDAAFNEDAYRDYRSKLVSECHQDIQKLNMKLVTVKLVREYVVKFSEITAFDFISEGDKNELITKIAPVVVNEDEDEYAKRFDNLMYGIIVSCIEGIPGFNRGKNQVMKVGTALQGKHTIPQVNAKMTLIKQVSDDAFWDAKDILAFETVRAELRDLIKFLDEKKGKIIITNLTDPILDIKTGETLPPAYDFEDYKKKVNRYVEENGNTMAIYKITHNIQLSSGDYNELERVLTSELGSREDYVREYGDTPFGLLIRKIAKLDHDAAMAAFSDFINDESLNQRQIAFVHKIITHIENNGYMESVKELQKPPFDKPVAFVKMFNKDQQMAIMKTINGIRDNAVVISA